VFAAATGVVATTAAMATAAPGGFGQRCQRQARERGHDQWCPEQLAR
jgi:hypothetical protein